MVGVEYILLHVQDPILYVIRKQHRHSPTEATPMADYYIIAGTVYQAPDLASVFNSRLLSTVHHLQGAFEEASGYARYHPSKGYTWDFSANKSLSEKSKSQTKKSTSNVKDDAASSLFQRQRVDMLLGELLRKFPLPTANITTNGTANAGGGNNRKEDPDQADGEIRMNGTDSSGGGDINIKQDRSEMKPPPEKKMKFGN